MRLLRTVVDTLAWGIHAALAPTPTLDEQLLVDKEAEEEVAEPNECNCYVYDPIRSCCRPEPSGSDAASARQAASAPSLPESGPGVEAPPVATPGPPNFTRLELLVATWALRDYADGLAEWPAKERYFALADKYEAAAYNTPT